jgi:hypothetical protein
VWALALALMKAARVMLLLRIALLLPLWSLSRPFLLFLLFRCWHKAPSA